MALVRKGRDGIRAGFVDVVEDQLPGLVGFDHQFDEGDHHLAEFAAGGMTSGDSGFDERSYLLMFGDQDYGPIGVEGGDPRSMWADYYDLSGVGPDFAIGRALAVAGERRGSGELLLPIPPLMDDETVFLRGFNLFNAFGTSNHHIRAMGIRFDTANHAWRVTFRDNSPSDDAFSADVFYFRVKREAPGMPADSLRFSEIRTVSREFRGSTTLPKGGIQGHTLLAGFHFEFSENDHHIRKIAVDLRDIRRVGMTFKDNDTPRVRGTVDYVELSGYP